MIFIIAEIGINHNGDLEIAKELIHIAKSCGCNAVKFQKRDINLVYSNEYLNEERQSPFGITQREQKEGLEFSLDDYNQINRLCKKLNIEWFASAWDLNSQEFLKGFNLNYNKISSPMLTNVDLLRSVASERKHTFISTGMSELDEIRQAIEIFDEYDCHFELMHCISLYPPKSEDFNLTKISRLRREFGVNVGFSDHSVDSLAAYASVGIGITSYERHVTLDKMMYGSDQKVSTDPSELRKLVSGIRTLEKSMGDGSLELNKNEIPNRNKLRGN